MTRVAVTGLGAVSGFGTGVKALWSGLVAGACAIRDLSLVDTGGFRCHVGAEVPGPVPGSPRRSRADRLALAAAREALDDAGLERGDLAAAALVVGAVGGGMLETETWYWGQGQGVPWPGAIGTTRSTLPCAHAGALARSLGIDGPRETVVTACSSGAVALGLAADLIRAGVVEVALAGGVDALTRLCFMGFNALKLLDPGPCRPFDRDRRGMSIGEGAAFVVLEAWGRARGRGAPIHAELAGHGMTTDAFHVTAPDPSGTGMVSAIRQALADAGAAPGDVGYVNAHGTGTVQNDRTEARAIAESLGRHVLVSSVKSMIGHTMAAAGSLEAVATVLALVHETVPPTINHEVTDPEVEFDCVPRTARPAVIETAISNSFGFGGQNATLVFRRGPS
jgi:3-oxoacyl-[acyl-carrier-protein] synthase II